MQHESVLLCEAVDHLVINPDGVYLDCTGGAGGHSQEILKRLSARGRLWVCDYHKETAEALKAKFVSDKRVTVVSSRFSRIFDNLNFSFDGILADFGISSPQLDDKRLGIGFLLEDIFLDMRLDDSLLETAADILKTHSEAELADLFFQLGGERGSRKIARAIVADREKDIFYDTTSSLRDLCARVLGRYYRGKKIHPATKVFQALRIAVNCELDEIKALLEQAPKKLNLNGRLVLISFHAGEDALVKACFRKLAETEDYEMPFRKSLKPSREETLRNPRARSARLRVLAKGKTQKYSKKGGAYE